jgi:hypothetical protein
MCADRIDAGLVGGPGVGVHQRSQQRQHGVALAAQPIKNLLFCTVCLGHRICSVITGGVPASTAV